MQIFIISIEARKENQLRLGHAFESIGLQPLFFNAITPDKDEYKAHRHNPFKSKLYNGRPLSPGEVGCYFSHYKLWEKCIELNEPILITEDDIELKESFLQVYHELDHLSEKYPYLKLHTTFSVKKELLERNESYGIYLNYKAPLGTVAYMVTPAAAKEFIECSKEWVRPVDKIVDSYWLFPFNCISIDPNPIGITEMPSTLNRSYKKRIIFKITREVTRRIEYYRMRKRNKLNQEEVVVLKS